MEDGYVRKMSDGVDVEVDMDNDVRIDEDIHKDYGQEIGKIVDCSKTFITTKVINKKLNIRFLLLVYQVIPKFTSHMMSIFSKA